MAYHSYRHLEQWEHWLTNQEVANEVFISEQQMLTQMLHQHYGKHAILIGVPKQFALLEATTLPCHSLVSPYVREATTPTIEADLHELPLLTGSADLVILPHTLELVDNPRQLLSEACRIIKPEGLILICGFNPYGVFGITRLLRPEKTLPWGGHLIHAQQIKNWLRLADFALEQQKATFFKPIIQNSTVLAKLNFLEKWGRHFFPGLGGIYIIAARAKVIPLTPIKMKWKQAFSGIRVSPTTGYIASQIKSEKF